MIETSNNLLFITAHADDHIMYAGTIMKLRDEFGMIPHEVVLTDSSSGPDFRREHNEDLDQVTVTRNGELDMASKFLGIAATYHQRQPDFMLQSTPHQAIKVAKIIQELRPQVLIMNGEFDEHDDHVAAHQIAVSAVNRAAKDLPSFDLDKPHRVPTILASEMMMPDRIHLLVDITKQMEQKKRLFEIYASQMSPRLTCYTGGLPDARGIYYTRGKLRSPKLKGFDL